MWDLQSLFNPRKLNIIHTWYKTPIKIVSPSPLDRAHLPPSNHMAFSNAIIRCEVYLPLHLYFVKILDYYNITPFQFAPNVYCFMVELYMLFHRLGLGEPELENFVWFYQVKTCSNNHGIYYFSKWVAEGLVGI